MFLITLPLPPLPLFALSSLCWTLHYSWKLCQRCIPMRPSSPSSHSITRWSCLFCQICIPRLSMLGPQKNQTKFTQPRTRSSTMTYSIFPTTIHRTTIWLDAQPKICSSTSLSRIWSYPSWFFFFLFSSFFQVKTFAHSTMSILNSSYSYSHIADCHRSTTTSMETGIPQRRIPGRTTWRNSRKPHHHRVDQLRKLNRWFNYLVVG